VYREQAASQSLGPDPIDEAMRVTSSAGWLQFGVLALLIVAAVAWACLTDIPIKIKAKGMLLGEQGIAEITLSTSGRVTEMDVQIGDYLKKGDLIAEVSQPDLEHQLSLREARLQELHAREAALLSFNKSKTDAQRAAAESRIRATRQRIQTLAEREQSLRAREANLLKLEQQGYVTKDTVLRNHIELTTTTDEMVSARNEVEIIQNDLRLNEVDQKKELSAVREEISILTSEVAQTRALLVNSREVRSPYSGRVIEVKFSLGEYAQTGSPMVSLVRSASDDERTESKLIVIAYVAPDQGKDIRPGMRVEVAPSSVQANEYGFIIGTVKSVSDAPATTAGMMRVLKNDQLVRQLSQQGAPFQVEVELAAAATPSGYRWTSSNGPNTTINSGTPCETRFVTRERRLLGLVIPSLAWLFSS
jgi:HlyD family secretion protein